MWRSTHLQSWAVLSLIFVTVISCPFAFRLKKVGAEGATIQFGPSRTQSIVEELYKTNNLLVSRLYDPLYAARAAMSNRWCDVSTTFFGEDAFKPVPVKGALAPLAQLGCCFQGFDSPGTPQPQELFHAGQQSNYHWYLFMDAKKAAQYGALGCPHNMNSKQYGPYAPEMRKQKQGESKKTLIDRSKSPRTLQQGQAFIAWVLSGGKRKIDGLDPVYMDKTQKQHFEGLRTSGFVDYNEEGFAQLQELMRQEPRDKAQPWNEVYIPMIDPSSIVGIGHSSMIANKHNKSRVEPDRDLFEMAAIVGGILGHEIEVVQYELPRGGGKYKARQVLRGNESLREEAKAKQVLQNKSDENP